MGELYFTVDSETPVQLQRYLRGRWGVSAGLLRRLKNREGCITRNGIPVRTVDIVEKGDIIVLSAKDGCALEPNGELSAKAVYESGSVVVFDKPAGMPVHPSAKHRDDTLGNLFAHLYPQQVFRPVNRLDKDTSGLCLIAKDPHAANVLQGKCEKTYFAAVHGLTEKSGTINAPIAREKESIILRCVREDGKTAVTHYKRILADEKYSLLEIKLETGRTHQIRVHFSHIGHPLAGDDLYGGLRSDIPRQALHCGKIIFRCPMTGEEITAVSELPEDIRKLFEEEIK